MWVPPRPELYILRAVIEFNVLDVFQAIQQTFTSFVLFFVKYTKLEGFLQHFV